MAKDFAPDWRSAELVEALEGLAGRSLRKKRNTILRLAEGLLIGRSTRETFLLPDTCSRSTWYGRRRNGDRDPGWRDQPEISDALNLAIRDAQYWADTETARAVTQATKRLAIAAPGAVGKLVMLMAQAKSEEVQRRSANDILDRVRKAASDGGQDQTDRRQTITLDLNGLPTEVLRAIAYDGQPEGNAESGEPGPDTPGR